MNLMYFSLAQLKFNSVCLNIVFIPSVTPARKYFISIYLSTPRNALSLSPTIFIQYDGIEENGGPVLLATVCVSWHTGLARRIEMLLN